MLATRLRLWQLRCLQGGQLTLPLDPQVRCAMPKWLAGWLATFWQSFAFFTQNCYRNLSKKVFQTGAVSRMILHHEHAFSRSLSGGVLRKQRKLI